jgi:hypothetical protein
MSPNIPITNTTRAGAPTAKILAFRSERVNNEYDVWMVYLDKDLEAPYPARA